MHRFAIAALTATLVVGTAHAQTVHMPVSNHEMVVTIAKNMNTQLDTTAAACDSFERLAQYERIDSLLLIGMVSATDFYGSVVMAKRLSEQFDIEHTVQRCRTTFRSPSAVLTNEIPY